MASVCCRYLQRPTDELPSGRRTLRPGQRRRSGGSLDGGQPGGGPAKPVSLMILNGADDPRVPYEGGGIGCGRQDLGRVRSAEGVVDLWAEINACTDRLAVDPLPEQVPGDGTRFRRLSYSEWADGSRVALYEIEGGGNTCPPASSTGSARNSPVARPSGGSPVRSAWPRTPNLRRSDRCFPQCISWARQARSLCARGSGNCANGSGAGSDRGLRMACNARRNRAAVVRESQPGIAGLYLRAHPRATAEL